MIRVLPVSEELLEDYLDLEIERAYEEIDRNPSDEGTVLTSETLGLGYRLQIKLASKSWVEMNLYDGSSVQIKNWETSSYGPAYCGKSDKILWALVNEHFDSGESVEVRATGNLLLLKTQKTVLNRIIFDVPLHCQNLHNLVFNGVVGTSGSYHTQVPLKDSLLNATQQQAVSMALNLTDENHFCLINGPPGSGKTRVISEIISHLADDGKSVLLTSNTNIAVDNALEALLDKYHTLRGTTLRIGRDNKLSPKIRLVLSDNLEKYNQKIRSLDSFNVVGATLAKLSFMILNDQIEWEQPAFDCVIVDESSMNTIPKVLMGITLASKFILVGDHLQLPPIIKLQKRHRAASRIEYEMQQSLFERLIKPCPSKGVFLDTQYRSNKMISRWPSQYLYENRLKTDTSVQDIQLDLRYNDPEDGLLFDVLNSKVPVIWIDTRLLHRGQWASEKERYGGPMSAYNVDEAALIKSIHQAVAPQMNARDIGIITVFRLQANILSAIINGGPPSLLASDKFTEIQTVNAFQGREKDLIIYNLVKTRPFPPRALDDERKLNVAITRARRKLIIVGSSDVASSNLKHYRSFFDYARRSCKIVRAERSDIKHHIVREIEDALENRLKIRVPA